MFREMLNPQKLYSVNLGDLKFWHTELIPAWASENGYSPDTDNQFAIFGPLSELEKWRQEKNLSEDQYPIHPAPMGNHIDIYGQKMADNLLNPTEIIDAISYYQQMQQIGLIVRAKL